MGDAEEIKRLAELRDQGVITTAEFGKRKRQILKSARPWWLTALIWIIGAWCLIGLLAIVIAVVVPVVRDYMAGDSLACDTPEVAEKALVLTNQSIAQMSAQLGIFAPKTSPGQPIHRLGSATQLYRDPDSGFLACIATTHNDSPGEGKIGYTVSWKDRNAGEFWIEVVSARELVDRYSNIARQVAAESLSIGSAAISVNESAHTSSEGKAFFGKCLLEVHGEKYIDAGCPITMDEDGSFSIGTDKRTPSKFFALVKIDGKGVATGYWNEEEGSGHAHSSLGSLRFQRGCWLNDAAKVCAWE